MSALFCSAAALAGWTVCEPFFAEGGSPEPIGAGNSFMGPFITGVIVAAFILIYRRSGLTYVDMALSIIAGFGIAFVIGFTLMIPSHILFDWCKNSWSLSYFFPSNSDFFAVQAGRGLSWSVFSLGAAVSLFVCADRSTVLCAASGCVLAGAIAGILFDPIQLCCSSFGFTAPWLSRLVCFAVLGGMSGLFFGIVQKIFTRGALLIVSGTLAGWRLVIDDSPCLIGASPKCDLVVHGQDLDDIVGIVEKCGFGYRFFCQAHMRECTINNKQTHSALLQPGDLLHIGGLSMVFSEISRQEPGNDSRANLPLRLFERPRTADNVNRRP
ncbi:hypothetical protein [Desulfomonile tiedjei]|nr:hypothetical protein [Desulfomonile tiedjei]